MIVLRRVPRYTSSVLEQYSIHVRTNGAPVVLTFHALGDPDAIFMAAKFISARIDGLGLDDSVTILRPDGSFIEEMTVERLVVRLRQKSSDV